MTEVAAVAHVIVGLAYIFSIGVMALLDVINAQRVHQRWDWLALGLVAMALTCGPHHLEHGIHLLNDVENEAHPLGLVTILVSVGPAALFTYLRFEEIFPRLHQRAIVAGRLPGDIQTTHETVGYSIATGMGAYVAVVAFLLPTAGLMTGPWIVQFPLSGLYLAIAWLLARTQWKRWKSHRVWSTAGLSLTLIWATCAITHLTYGWLVGIGVYTSDVHITVFDSLGIAAATGFLWAVRKARGR